MVFLSLDDILESHQNQIDTYGGSHGIRDIGLLESALAQPETSFGGHYLPILMWPYVPFESPPAFLEAAFRPFSVIRSF